MIVKITQSEGMYDIYDDVIRYSFRDDYVHLAFRDGREVVSEIESGVFVMTDKGVTFDKVMRK